MDKMDHFFGCTAALMANLLRSTVENSIGDLVDLLEEYSDGNAYNGQYNIFRGLALPQLVHPVTVFLVKWRLVNTYIKIFLFTSGRKPRRIVHSICAKLP